MKTLVGAIAVLGAVVVGRASVCASEPQGSAKPKPAYYESTKAMLDRIGPPSDFVTGKPEKKDMNMPVELKPEIMPALIELFRENPDDTYRTRILGFMFITVKRNESAAMDFVDEELAKDPMNWRKSNWPGAALYYIQKLAPDRAIRTAVRCLAAKDGKVELNALSVLVNIGGAAEMEIVEAYLANRKQSGSIGRDPRSLTGSEIEGLLKTMKARLDAEQPKS